MNHNKKGKRKKKTQLLISSPFIDLRISFILSNFFRHFVSNFLKLLCELWYHVNCWEHLLSSGDIFQHLQTFSHFNVCTPFICTPRLYGLEYLPLTNLNIFLNCRDYFFCSNNSWGSPWIQTLREGEKRGGDMLVQIPYTIVHIPKYTNTIYTIHIIVHNPKIHNLNLMKY